MTTQAMLDEGYELWYIVLEHTNHRFTDATNEPFIYDDLGYAKTKASGLIGVDKYIPMMVKDFNQKFRKHMDVVE